jgi:hypothetical protein
MDTTHYSQAELGNLIAAVEKVCESESRETPENGAQMRNRPQALHAPGRCSLISCTSSAGVLEFELER